MADAGGGLLAQGIVDDGHSTLRRHRVTGERWAVIHQRHRQVQQDVSKGRPGMCRIRIGEGLEAGDQLHESSETRQGAWKQGLQHTEQGPSQINETAPALLGIGH